jgi:hypothetical protein
MNSKPYKDCENRGDIILISEIITDSIYWQAVCTRNSIKIGGYFTASHKLDRSPDNQFICLFCTIHRPQHMVLALLFSIKQKNDFRN